MTPFEELQSLSDPAKIDAIAAYHKVERPYLGVTNPLMNDLCKRWRQEMTLDERLSVAADLWGTNAHEARVCAAKLLTQARIKDDDAVWTLLQSWVPDFDAWAIADHACSAISRRLSAQPSRLDTVETWTKSDHMWTKRAALVATLPWTKQNHPSSAEEKARDRILGWAGIYVSDPEWFIQKSVSWWVRELSKHDAPRARAFLEEHGGAMKNFARKDASRHLEKVSKGQ